MNNNSIYKIIGTINSMQTLIENFPMWLFSMAKTSKMPPINFIIEVLHQIGVRDFEIINRIIALFFNVQNALENVQNLERFAFDVQSEFLVSIEKETKYIISTILNSILSCSIVPKIPEEYLDNEEKHTISTSIIDIANLLDICPTTEVGKNFYDIDDNMTPNMLYKSYDMNAMLWYAMNRGSDTNQSEKNKLMWDSRFIEKEYDDYYRDDASKWNEWFGSKEDENGIFYVREKKDIYDNANQSGNTINLPLHPIIQFYPDDSNSKNLNYSISRQTFSGKTLQEFNDDYLNNIEIFTPRNIIGEMINRLLNNNVKNMLNIEYSLQSKLIDDKIDELIARAIDVDDTSISDCFFSFSNDDLNSMMEEMERQRYSGKLLNSETAPSIKINENYGIELLNEINSSATINEKIETLTRSIYEISKLPENDEAIQISDKTSVGYNSEWFNSVVMAIVRPLVKSIINPKVILLFIINFDIIGLIDINDIDSFDDIMKLFYKKLFSIILSIVRFIKDSIIKFLLNLFYEKITPLIEQYTILLVQERLKEWTDLLVEAAMCIGPFPYINFSWSKTLNQIDDVRYADITQEQIEPETTKTC